MKPPTALGESDMPHGTQSAGKSRTIRSSDRPGREAELTVLGNAPLEPIKPLLTAPEPTVEALAKHWPVLPGALGLFSSEGGQMTGGHGLA